MLERELEKMFVKAVRNQGGQTPKWTSPGLSGVPDRMVLMPGGRIGFVELKAPGEKPRPLQVHRMKQLEKLGFRCFVLDNPGQIEEVLSEIRAARVPSTSH